MNQPSKRFRFINPGPLIDGELQLVLAQKVPADPARRWVPGYEFEMRVGTQRTGRIGLRISKIPLIVNQIGNIGYTVDPEHQGKHFAERACRLILPLAKSHGLDAVWIMCDSENVASKRTCERLGATLVDTVTAHNEPDRLMCRYKIDL